MFNFPSPVTEGATYTPAGGLTYIYQSGVWNIQTPATPADLTLTGDLTVGDDVTIGGDVTIAGTSVSITAAGPNFWLNDTGTTGSSIPYMGAQRNGSDRWWFALGYGAESTANAGSDFALERYADNGAFISNAMTVKRSNGDVTFYGNVLPFVTGYNLGSSALRWGTVYTSDLSLSNGIGDWTIVEGADDLFITNNKNGKKYKFAMIEVEDGD